MEGLSLLDVSSAVVKLFLKGSINRRPGAMKKILIGWKYYCGRDIDCAGRAPLVNVYFDALIPVRDLILTCHT